MKHFLKSIIALSALALFCQLPFIMYGADENRVCWPSSRFLVKNNSPYPIQLKFTDSTNKVISESVGAGNDYPIYTPPTVAPQSINVQTINKLGKVIAATLNLSSLKTGNREIIIDKEKDNEISVKVELGKDAQGRNLPPLMQLSTASELTIDSPAKKLPAVGDKRVDIVNKSALPSIVTVYDSNGAKQQVSVPSGDRNEVYLPCLKRVSVVSIVKSTGQQVEAVLDIAPICNDTKIEIYDKLDKTQLVIKIEPGKGLPPLMASSDEQAQGTALGASTAGALPTEQQGTNNYSIQSVSNFSVDLDIVHTIGTGAPQTLSRKIEKDTKLVVQVGCVQKITASVNYAGQTMLQISYPSTDVVVLKATYGAGNQVKDVTSILQDKFKGKAITYEGSYNSLFGDPDPKRQKELVITWVDSNQHDHINKFAQDSKIQIPEPKKDNKPAFSCPGAHTIELNDEDAHTRLVMKLDGELVAKSPTAKAIKRQEELTKSAREIAAAAELQKTPRRFVWEILNKAQSPITVTLTDEVGALVASDMVKPEGKIRAEERITPIVGCVNRILAQGVDKNGKPVSVSYTATIPCKDTKLEIDDTDGQTKLMIKIDGKEVARSSSAAPVAAQPPAAPDSPRKYPWKITSLPDFTLTSVKLTDEVGTQEIGPMKKSDIKNPIVGCVKAIHIEGINPSNQRVILDYTDLIPCQSNTIEFDDADSHKKLVLRINGKEVFRTTGITTVAPAFTPITTPPPVTAPAPTPVAPASPRKYSWTVTSLPDFTLTSVKLTDELGTQEIGPMKKYDIKNPIVGCVKAIHAEGMNPSNQRVILDYTGSIPCQNNTVVLNDADSHKKLSLTINGNEVFRTAGISAPPPPAPTPAPTPVAPASPRKYSWKLTSLPDFTLTSVKLTDEVGTQEIGPMKKYDIKNPMVGCVKAIHVEGMNPSNQAVILDYTGLIPCQSNTIEFDDADSHKKLVLRINGNEVFRTAGISAPPPPAPAPAPTVAPRPVTAPAPIAAPSPRKYSWKLTSLPDFTLTSVKLTDEVGTQEIGPMQKNTIKNPTVGCVKAIHAEGINPKGQRVTLDYTGSIPCQSNTIEFDDADSHKKLVLRVNGKEVLRTAGV